MGFGFGFMDTAFPVMFTIVFVLIFGMIAVTLVRGIGEWNKNNHSPRLVVDAEVVTKRADVSHHAHPNAGDTSGAHGFHHTSSTTYYVTFEVKGGERLEFAVPGAEYGQLVEGDRGELTFQGTRFLSFERKT